MNENTVFAHDAHTSATVSAHAGGCPPVVSSPETELLRTEISDADSTAELPTLSNPLHQTHWFAMRSSYSRELKAKELLEKDHFTCYVPLKRERKEKNGNIMEIQVPVVHNLIFVQSSRSALDPWKHLHEEDAALRYTIDKSTGLPMIVDDKSMQDFIRVTAESDESLLYLDNPDIILTKGQRVEIVLGPFKGVQGHILRIRRDRRVVVTIAGLVSVALATMPQSHFKIIN